MKLLEPKAYIASEKAKASFRKPAKVWTLTDEQAYELVMADCIYCGTPPVTDEHLSNGIDRVDNKKGYLPDNCVPCCGYCNFMKGAMTKDVFLEQVRMIYESQNRQAQTHSAINSI